jgi:hypothetical protein
MNIRAIISRMMNGIILRKNNASVIPRRNKMIRIMARPAINPRILVII